MLEVQPPQLEPVLAAMDPEGWVNLRPAVDPDDDPGEPSRMLLGMFGARGPAVPLCTWHPGERQVGIEHSWGPKVSRRLSIPEGWRVVQDHPRRGIVLAVPAGVSDEEVLTWLIEVGSQLCTIPTDGTWVVQLFP